MVSFEEAAVMLDEIALELPGDIFIELNGGINLLPDVKPHPDGESGELYIMGEYCHNNIGRYINVYYGSVMRLYHRLPRESMREKLIGILKHEFTHHLESLAGERELIIKDMIQIEKYKERDDVKK